MLVTKPDPRRRYTQRAQLARARSRAPQLERFAHQHRRGNPNRRKAEAMLQRLGNQGGAHGGNRD